MLCATRCTLAREQGQRQQKWPQQRPQRQRSSSSGGSIRHLLPAPPCLAASSSVRLLTLLCFVPPSLLFRTAVQHALGLMYILSRHLLSSQHTVLPPFLPRFCAAVRPALDGTPFLYTLNMSCPQELWPDLEAAFQRGVDSFRCAISSGSLGRFCLGTFGMGLCGPEAFQRGVESFGCAVFSRSWESLFFFGMGMWSGHLAAWGASGAD